MTKEQRQPSITLQWEEQELHNSTNKISNPTLISSKPYLQTPSPTHRNSEHFHPQNKRHKNITVKHKITRPHIKSLHL